LVLEIGGTRDTRAPALVPQRYFSLRSLRLHFALSAFKFFIFNNRNERRDLRKGIYQIGDIHEIPLYHRHTLALLNLIQKDK